MRELVAGTWNKFASLGQVHEGTWLRDSHILSLIGLFANLFIYLILFIIYLLFLSILFTTRGKHDFPSMIFPW